MNLKYKRCLVTIIISLCLAVSAFGTTFVSANPIEYSSVIQTQKYDAKKAKKNLKVTYKKTSDGIIVICKNQNAFDIKLNGTVKFKDAANNILSTESDELETVSAKKTVILYFQAPKNANGDTIKYAKYSKAIKVSKPGKTSYAGKIQCTTNTQTTGFNLSVFNNSGKNLDIIRVSCVLYDANHNIVGYTKKYVTCYQKKSSVLETVAYPYDCQNPATVKCYVDTAYKY